ncbi:MAG: NUDIX hydrolase [Pedosphaera sp. Tous-C6FEB]|nr:MAG: NUDIX hydrolase [Pedosphaera sp. Tous-C6FEB]
MTEEIFDVVDDRDRIISRQTRREVHLRGLKHRAVHVLVFNQRGELFLQKRSFKKDTFPGAWDSSASGHLDAGENYDTCAVRELREEIGLVVPRCPKRQFKIDACEETGREFVWVYRCDANGPFRLNQEELECGAFFKPDHINRWMAERPRDFADAFRLVWKYFLNPPAPKPAKARPVAKPSPAKPAPRPSRKAPTPVRKQVKSTVPTTKTAPPKKVKQKVRSAKRSAPKPSRRSPRPPVRTPAKRRPSKPARKVRR